MVVFQTFKISWYFLKSNIFLGENSEHSGVIIRVTAVADPRKPCIKGVVSFIQKSVLTFCLIDSELYEEPTSFTCH